MDLPLGMLLAHGVVLKDSAWPSICERQNDVLYAVGIGVCLLAGLDVPLSALLFTVGLVVLLMGCTSVEGFGWLCSGLGFLL